MLFSTVSYSAPGVEVLFKSDDLEHLSPVKDMNELLAGLTESTLLTAKANRVPEEASPYCLKSKQAWRDPPIKCQTVKVQMLTLQSEITAAFIVLMIESIVVPMFIVAVALMRVFLRLPSQKCHTGIWHGLPSVLGWHLPRLHSLQ